uniref:Uncharacterized protein n=1 Tax=Arundo donax TaxID=35708 RepID=A0A0A9NBE2_ARUDO
MALPMGSS